ncbi:hypothetical protein [Nocardioides exalbidus]|uniref:hypothetical protein n=1 Tax=Nocardioides exalbidus TaxID=402596 RepID=UPI0011152253|nr:hypothetical protein [Nocardioides exalbidus]
MKRWSYDLALAVAAGLIVLAVTVGLDWLDGWQAWVAAAAVALVTLALLFYVARRRVGSENENSSYNFASGLRAKTDLEVRDTSVGSAGDAASHVSDSKAGGSIRITGSKFTHRDSRGDRSNDADG